MRAREVRVQGRFYVLDSMYHGRYDNKNLNRAPNNTHNLRNYRELPLLQQWTPGEGTPAPEGPPTGEGTSTTSPTAEDVEGEVDAGATTTSASLLPNTQEPQICESSLTVSSTYFMCNTNNHVVTLNPAPTGSLKRQILVSEGSGGPLSTEWNMSIFPELNKTELKQPLKFPYNGTQGGTHPTREHRERNLSITSNHPKNKSKSKKHPETGKIVEKHAEHLTQTSIMNFIQKGEKRLNITQLTPDGGKKLNTRNIITQSDKDKNITMVNDIINDLIHTMLSMLISPIFAHLGHTKPQGKL